MRMTEIKVKDEGAESMSGIFTAAALQKMEFPPIN